VPFLVHDIAFGAACCGRRAARRAGFGGAGHVVGRLVIELLGQDLAQDALRALIRHGRDLAEVRAQHLPFCRAGERERRPDSGYPSER
jgi:hypothetical protein